MTIGTSLYDALRNDSGVAALVSQRIYPLQLPQTPTYEAISYERVSNTPQNGSTNMRRTRWSISCWAATYGEAHTLANAVKAAMEDYRGGDIKLAMVENEIDDYDDDAEVYRTIVDVMLVTHND